MIFSVLDVETTGLSAKNGDRILEIGVVQLDASGKIKPVFDTLINPGTRVKATRIHGITNKMVRGAPGFPGIVHHLSSILDRTLVVAHNASFDIGFLKEEFRRSGVSFPHFSPICTLAMAQKYLPTLPSGSLDACRTFLGITDEGSHNALADARSAAVLLKYLIDQFHTPVNMVPFHTTLHDGSGWLPDFSSLLKPRNSLGE